MRIKNEKEPVKPRAEAFLEEGTAKVKALSQGKAQPVRRTTERKPVHPEYK